MVCRECTAYDSGKIKIVLPVFDECEYASVRNRFYSSAADVIYTYAKKVIESCKCKFFCSFAEEDSENEEKASITLELSIHRRGERTLRRRITHCWKGGRLLGKIVR